MAIRIQCVCIDSTDPAALAAWWAEALGWRVTFDDGNEAAVEPPAGSPEDGLVPDLLFVRVPDAATTKNRLHLDLRPTDQPAEVSRLVGLGATEVQVGQPADAPWTVLSDPEGNEFCVLPPLAPAGS